MKTIFLFFILTFSFAGISAENVSPMSPVELAQAKALLKQRKEACAILVGAIEANKAQPKVVAKLQDALDAISTTFFTDKGQKLFESAQAAAIDNAEIAISTLKEVRLLEDQNLLVNLALARIYIARKEYDAANEILTVSRQLNPRSQDALILSLKLNLAEGKFEVFRGRAVGLSALNKNQDIFLKQFVAQDYWHQQLTRKAFDLFQKISELEPAYPESYFFLAKTGQELGKNTEDWSRRYVSLCKNIDARTRRKYGNEPNLCGQVKEIEDELAKKTSEN